MKAYTDIYQSKKLAEILSIESADMGYLWNGISSYCDYPVSNQTIFKRIENIPCWSFAALMDVLDCVSSFKTPQGWTCQTYVGPKVVTSNYYSNPVDACVEIILKLKEKNLI